MPAKNRANPLALAVLVCLAEQPRHPYEVATTLRQRQKHESVRLNYGSLYGVVESLERRGLIEAQETRRVRPAPGADRLPADRSRADRGARLAHRAALDAGQGVPRVPGRAVVPARAAPRGRGRRCWPSAPSTSRPSSRRPPRPGNWRRRRGLPRLFWVEAEFDIVLREAELGYVRQLIARHRVRRARRHGVVARDARQRPTTTGRAAAVRPRPARRRGDQVRPRGQHHHHAATCARAFRGASGGRGRRRFAGSASTCARGEIFGFLGPERRRQDHHAADADHAAADRLRHRDRGGLRRRPAAEAGPRPGSAT